jgi:hypothetical protein
MHAHEKHRPHLLRFSASLNGDGHKQVAFGIDFIIETGIFSGTGSGKGTGTAYIRMRWKSSVT